MNIFNIIFSPNFGEFALAGNILLNILILLLTIIHRNNKLHANLILEKLFYLQSLFLLVGLFILITAYINSNFQFLNVWENSAIGKPLGYRIAATWGNHEGSMLLWLTFLSLQLSVFVKTQKHSSPQMRMLQMQIGTSLQLLFSAYIMLASNPFIELSPVPLQGQDLNPVLQDVLLLIHPPLLYLGTSGTAVLFIIGASYSFTNDNLRNSIFLVEKFALLSWVFLTIGIALGSYWAYYELGWGGWWFWDPVENSSFIPWLLLLALLHALKIVRTRNSFHFGTISLCILPFLTVILGTFLVRSGILTSVHAFAVDPNRGIWLLAILFIVISFGLFSTIWVKSSIHNQYYKILSRDFLLRLNVVFMVTTATIVSAGVMYPLVVEAVNGDKISVGQPFFESITFPFSVFMFALMVISPFFNWGGLHTTRPWQKFALIIVGCGFLYSLNSNIILNSDIIYQVFFVLGCALLISPFFEGRKILSEDLTIWGTRIAHFGVGLAILGALFASQNKIEVSKPLGVGQNYRIAGYTIELDKLTQETTSSYVALVAHLIVRHEAGISSNLRSERRMYTIRNSQTTEVALSTHGMNQLYIALGEIVNEKQLIIRTQFKPKILLLWFGVGFMALGGIVSGLKRGRI